MQRSYLDVSSANNAHDITASSLFARLPQTARQNEVPLALHYLSRHQRVCYRPFWHIRSCQEMPDTTI